MSQARRPLRSDVELPIPVQGSLLDFSFAQEEVQCCGNGIGALAKLFSQVALADDYIASWVALMDIAPVARYLIGERPKFSLLLTLRTLGSGLVSFETPSARSCNSDSTSDHRAASPV